jgi:hypothetical protein
VKEGRGLECGDWVEKWHEDLLKRMLGCHTCIEVVQAPREQGTLA